MIHQHTKYILLGILLCAGCSDRGTGDPARPQLPSEVANVHLGMSKADVIAARPEAREHSYGITERVSPGVEATYLFRDHLPAQTGSGKNGLLAVQVDYMIADDDTVSGNAIVAAAEKRWGRFDQFRSAPIRRQVRKYTSSPPLRTAASVWDAPAATAVVYEELEVARNSLDRYRLVRLIVQEPSMAATALLPSAYRAD